MPSPDAIRRSRGGARLAASGSCGSGRSSCPPRARRYLRASPRPEAISFWRDNQASEASRGLGQPSPRRSAALTAETGKRSDWHLPRTMCRRRALRQGAEPPRPPRDANGSASRDRCGPRERRGARPPDVFEKRVAEQAGRDVPRYRTAEGARALRDSGADGFRDAAGATSSTPSSRAGGSWRLARSRGDRTSAPRPLEMRTSPRRRRPVVIYDGAGDRERFSPPSSSSSSTGSWTGS